jgi:hypothetical protein
LPADHDNGFMIALRDRSLCPYRPNLSGFDLVSFEIADRDTFHHRAQGVLEQEFEPQRALRLRGEAGR